MTCKQQLGYDSRYTDNNPSYRFSLISEKILIHPFHTIYKNYHGSSSIINYNPEAYLTLRYGFSMIVVRCMHGSINAPMSVSATHARACKMFRASLSSLSLALWTRLRM